jgi:Tfp pilus assembly protein PilO
MAKEEKKKKGFLPPNVQVLLLPIIYIVILVSISYFAIKTGYDKITSQRRSISSAKQVEKVLGEKESVLQEAQAETTDFVNAAAIALPERNPSLAVISQIKSLIGTEGVALSDLKLGSSIGTDVTGASSVNISFSISGDAIQVFDFVRSTATVAPILRIESADISFVESQANLDARARSYWAPFPEKLPSITEPINKLTDAEYKILRDLSGLNPPQFTELSPTGTTGRTNPFGL